jgi:hypothetical protein
VDANSGTLREDFLENRTSQRTEFQKGQIINDVKTAIYNGLHLNDVCSKDLNPRYVTARINAGCKC